MKKLLMTVAVLGCAASIVSAQTVTSANMVGYSKKAVPALGLDMFAPQFLAGDAGGITLADAFPSVSEGTQLFQWDTSVTPAGYKSYIYYSPSWYDSAWNPADDSIIGQGDAVWFLNGSVGADVIMSGEVPSATSITNALAAGLNMVANPYPVALGLDDIPVSFLSEGDTIYFWDTSVTPAAYKSYLYYSPIWYDSAWNDVTATAEIPVGQGFWLISEAGGDLVLDKQF